jgi:hypothetical protein
VQYTPEQVEQIVARISELRRIWLRAAKAQLAAKEERTDADKNPSENAAT